MLVLSLRVLEEILRFVFVLILSYAYVAHVNQD